MSSSDCTVKGSVVLERGFGFIRAPNVLIGFGKTDNQVNSCGVIKESITIDGCRAEEIIFRVVPDDLQPYDLIIGRNFTELPHMAYFKLDDKFTFQNRDDFIFSENPKIEADKSDRNKIVFDEENVIPAASIKFIRVKLGTADVTLSIENTSDRDISLSQEKRLKNQIFSIKGNIPEMPPRKEPITE